MQCHGKRVECFCVIMYVFVQCRGKRVGCFCVMLYAFCAVPWEESWVFLCDDVGVLCSAVGRELGVFV